ncbi:MAG: Maf family nucleotide pyrophosphatase [Gammaproteobacteria bacterium]|nr:Maf family nucleotide pyrophosphatase [Gammaproteobacteria bacterium]MDH5592688.1 Maf family nucleotide pyrophosphatase [Gammaproteobacteria bacterium]
MTFPPVYLASSSPRRRELLTQIGVTFTVLTVDVDEHRLDQESPSDYVKRVAIAKAQAGWESLTEQDKMPVLGADTSVVMGDEVFGKPIDKQDARVMLQCLSGHHHQVMTAVAVVTGEQVLCELSTSAVTFASMTDSEIDWYLATNEGIDKAGSYAVQGLAALFIEQIEGSYSGIMGLPLRETGALLKQIIG